jgi:hypothetical protein
MPGVCVRREIPAGEKDRLVITKSKRIRRIKNTGIPMHKFKR